VTTIDAFGFFYIFRGHLPDFGFENAGFVCRSGLPSVLRHCCLGWYGIQPVKTPPHPQWSWCMPLWMPGGSHPFPLAII